MVSEYMAKLEYMAMQRLNPCFSGGWSRRPTYMVGIVVWSMVLILVLVEDGLGEFL